MADYFRIGEPVGVPPPGKKVILCDTDGSFKSMDSAGTKSAIGGGGGTSDSSPVWVQQIRARSTLLNGGAPFVNGEYYTAIDDANYATTTPAGTATATVSTTDATTLVLATGVNNSSDIKVTPPGLPVLVVDLTTRAIYGYWKVQFTNAVQDGHLAWLGFTDPSLAHKTVFGIITPTQVTGGSNTNYSTFTSGAAAAVATSLAVDITVPHEVEAISNGAGSINWLIDQVVVATVAITSGNYGANPALVFGQAALRQPGGLTSCGFKLIRMFSRF